MRIIFIANTKFSYYSRMNTNTLTVIIIIIIIIVSFMTIATSSLIKNKQIYHSRKRNTHKILFRLFYATRINCIECIKLTRIFLIRNR
jgi:hypothetical protein